MLKVGLVTTIRVVIVSSFLMLISYYKSSHRVFISNAHKFVDVKVSTVDSLPTKKVLSQHDKYRKVFTISQKLANLASYISTREFSYAVECLENIVKAWEQGKRVTVQVVDASSDVVEQDDNDLTNSDESLTNFADLEDSTSASFSAVATDAPCDNGWDSESSLMDYDHSCVNDTSVADQWRIQDGAFGANAPPPPPPLLPPSRNCIQDRHTLIKQSVTLIKQSQCS